MGDKREEIVPLPEKGDKTQNEVTTVVDGHSKEIVFIAEYNPDQMARCIDEIYTTVLLLNKTGAWRVPYAGMEPEEEADDFFTFADFKDMIESDPPAMPESKATKGKGKKRSVSNEHVIDEEEYYIPSVYPILGHIERDEDHGKHSVA